MKRTRKQIGSLLLAVCMVFTMMPAVAFADSTSQIISFEALADDVDFQEVKSGTTVDGLNLANTLTATVTTGSAYTATVSDWVSVPLYDGNTTGNYTFTPTLNLPSDVTLADGVTPPTITLYVLPFVPVKSIDGVINVIGVGNSYALGGRAYPANATNQDISWSISDAGTTGATITDGIISATTAGTVIVKAEIINGKANGTNYIENASIRVMALTVDSSTYTFDPLEEGYGKDEYFYLDDAQPKTFTITNTGDTVIKEINLRFLLNDGSRYSTSSIPTSLNSKASAEFTVEPISNLSAGNYTTIFYVCASNDVLALIPVSLTVTERLPRLRFGETDVHKADTDFSGTGYSWNATTKTLTLTSDYEAGSIEFFDFDSEMATLKLSGDVTIDEQSSNFNCINNPDNLTIDLGGHTLTLITGGDNNEALCGKEITIQNGTLVARLLGSGTENNTSSIYAHDITVENAAVIADADNLNYGGIQNQGGELTLKQGAKIYTCGAIGLYLSNAYSLNLASDNISLTAIGSTAAISLDAGLDYTSGSALKCWTNTDATQPSPVGDGVLLSSKTYAEEWEILWISSKYVYIGTESPKSIVTVTNGTGSGEYSQNATVTITADAAPSGKRFKEWTVVSGDVTLANAQASSTTFTMPAKAVEVTATYTSGGGSGSSSSGSSSGGSSPTNTATLKKNQPNQPITAVSSVTATVGTNGKANASIPDKAVTDAISKAQEEATKQKKTKNGISIGLNVKMPKGATTLTATLSQNALNSLVSAGVTNLEINGSPVVISFDKKALKEIQKQTNGNVNIIIAPKTNLTETAKKMIGTRPVYNITVGHGNNDTVSNFSGGVATIAIPYTPANGEVISGLYAVYVDENGNATRVEGLVYDIDSGSVLFTTPHFSMYGVGYTVPSEKLTDISTHWAKESIDYVVDKGMIDGATETTFAPDTFMTRGTLVTALGRLTGKDVSSYTTSSFTDVDAGSTSQPYIEWAYKEGIIHGIGNYEFAPERAITREEIAVIIANFTNAIGYTLPVNGEATAYTDASSIGDYYKTAVTAMQQAGIMTGGTGNKFYPKSNATRAEVSSMLHRYIKLIVD